MNVSCPQCKTVFRVDPQKVPEDGVRARCSVCGGVFEVVAGADEAFAGVRQEGAAEAAAEPEQPAPQPGPEAPSEPRQTFEEPSPGAAPSDAPQAEHPSPPSDPIGEQPTARIPGGAQPPSGAQPGAPAGPARPFGQADPEARARRLARALISDLVTYHPDKQQLGLREGRLKELFREEIKKSWQEYVDQVGLDMAKGTPYFRDALNEILAKGRRVF